MVRTPGLPTGLPANAYAERRSGEGRLDVALGTLKELQNQFVGSASGKEPTISDARRKEVLRKIVAAKRGTTPTSPGTHGQSTRFRRLRGGPHSHWKKNPET